MKHTPPRDASISIDCVSALPQTRWSVVARAGDRARASWSDDLQSITRLYRPVLVRHLVTHMQVPPDRADDLVQTFLFEKLLEQNVVRMASPDKGRFRSFILKTFSNFTRDELRRQQAQKRTPSHPDSDRIDDLPELPSGETPLSEALDALWARQVVQRALDLMREECRSPNRQNLWGVMEARIIGPIFDEAPPMPYEAFVAKFGLRSPSEASNLLITAKRMFIRSLRKAVRETVARDSEVEPEIMELKRVLSK